jgi:predicted nucleic-acid-binding protein
MIGLDTNVVVRYLTHDDPAQTAAAIKVFESFSAHSRGFLSLVVVVELVWVLEEVYELKKDEIMQVLEKLLRSKELVVEQAELVWQGLRAFASSRADFSDCIIERCGQAAGCQHTVTFDKHAATAGIQLLR